MVVFRAGDSMAEGLLIAKNHNGGVAILPQMANRHGIITGASGTGKTVTLQVIAEHFSHAGIPVFVADVKGDLAGLSQTGIFTPMVQQRLELLGVDGFAFGSSPVVFWDVFGKQGHPLRATVSELGPILLSRLLSLTSTQKAALNAIFQIADDEGLLLLDVKDLSSMLEYVGENGQQFQARYGRITRATTGAIQRSLLMLNTIGGESFFGEPALDLFDFLRVDARGRGIINVLAANTLFRAPEMYATVLLWLLALLYQVLPEVGDLPQPKLVFFFDEAHLLFTDTPKEMRQRISQLVRLIRSKGVGVYFVSQTPSDLPDEILAQLGNRVQHALRAFTPRDQQVVRAAARTFRSNPELNIETAITQLAVGEALISYLDADGMPGVTKRAWVLPPHSQVGPIPSETRRMLISQSAIYGKYEQAVDRESAYEVLAKRASAAAQAAAQQAATVPPPKKSSKKKQKAAPPPDQGVVSDISDYAGRRIQGAIGHKVRGMFGSFLGETK